MVNVRQDRQRHGHSSGDCQYNIVCPPDCGEKARPQTQPPLSHRSAHYQPIDPFLQGQHAPGSDSVSLRRVASGGSRNRIAHLARRLSH